MIGLLSPVYGAGVRTRNALYDRGKLPVHRLQAPVVSVGNLSVGGSGKTPFVILLGQLLAARGIGFDVLSRGYGRSTRGVALVDPAGSPSDFGDEPLLIARRLGAPVIVGEERYLAGRFAENKFGPQLHLLDDGFQHRALARDFDIVLLSADDSGDRLLPAGRLREPLSSLRRADAVVFTGDSADTPVPARATWRVRRGIQLKDVPAHPIAFCGIARPEWFLAELREAGVDLAAEAVYRDHHAYRERDVRDLLELQKKIGAAGFVTTEKDEINLGSLRSQLRPLAVVRVTMELLDANAALDSMLAAIADRRNKRP